MVTFAVAFVIFHLESFSVPTCVAFGSEHNFLLPLNSSLLPGPCSEGAGRPPGFVSSQASKRAARLGLSEEEMSSHTHRVLEVSFTHLTSLSFLSQVP